MYPAGLSTLPGFAPATLITPRGTDRGCSVALGPAPRCRSRRARACPDKLPFARREFVTAVLPPGTQLLRAYSYDSLPYVSEVPSNDEMERFTRKERWLHAIEHVPQMDVWLGRVAMREDGTVVQKRVDVLLAMDIVRVAYKHICDVVVLVAGESDYVPLVGDVN